MNKEFWSNMKNVSNIMADLEAEHERFFSNEEELQLLNYKKNFVDSILFWSESKEMNEEEKMNRIRWEYNNMFDLLCKIIDKNVEEWDNNTNNNKNDDYDF
jgi:hypothetical protein